MKPIDFANQYERLVNVFPAHYNSEEKKSTVWKTVDELDISWFTRLVDRIVISARADKIDIGEAAAAERRAIRSAEQAESISRLMDANAGKISDEGFNRVMKAYGARNIWDAVEKSRKEKNNV